MASIASSTAEHNVRQFCFNRPSIIKGGSKEGENTRLTCDRVKSGTHMENSGLRKVMLATLTIKSKFIAAGAGSDALPLVVMLVRILSQVFERYWGNVCEGGKLRRLAL